MFGIFAVGVNDGIPVLVGHGVNGVK